MAKRRRLVVTCIATVGVIGTQLPGLTGADAAPNFASEQLAGSGTYSVAWTVNTNGEVGGNSDSIGSTGVSAAIWPKPRQLTMVDPDGKYSSQVYDLNENGVAVGTKTKELADGTSAYMWANGQPMELPSLNNGWRNDYADEVNDSGQVVGYSLDDDLVGRAVTWVNGSLINLTPGPEAYSAGAFGINNAGVITGSRNQVAVVWVNGKLRELNIPRPLDIPSDAVMVSDGRSINDNGDIAGYVAWSNDSGSGYRAFLWSSGITTFLRPSHPETSECIAYGINLKREVVGGCYSSDRALSRAFFWSNGIMQDPGTLPGDVSSFAQAINDKSDFVGYSTGSDGITHAVRWR